VLRAAVLGLAHRKAIRSIATSGIGRRVALRFVAGETLDDAVKVIRKLDAAGASASIDYLGENVVDLDLAANAARVYERALDRIRAENLPASVSLKLTQMGLDLDPAVAYAHAEAIAGRARAAGTSVTLDMEDHSYTERTLEMCVRLSAAHPGHVGVALQACLKRSAVDLDRLISAGVHVRLCKGAYREPRSLAYQRRGSVAAAFARLAERLLGSGSYAMIATHDEDLIARAIAEARRRGLARDRFEFQMLYGVRRELQQRLVAQGYRLRVYVPFGDQWYPYLTRRIAERPANVRFFAEALIRK